MAEELVEKRVVKVLRRDSLVGGEMEKAAQFPPLPSVGE
jgi:hypothetical protein